MINKIKKRKALTFTIIITLCAAGISWLWYHQYSYSQQNKITTETLSGLNLDGYDRLMIVAHPDDEMLWGGAHLIEDNYFVVCLTNRKRQDRSSEFYQVMEQTGNVGYMFNYPDLLAGRQSRWLSLKSSIEENLETIVNYKDWELIVTHSEQAEYGHQHHAMIHELVTAAYYAADSSGELYYFGHYYQSEEIPDGLTQISKELLIQKYEILQTYSSQASTINSFRHMLPYELWETADKTKTND